eukprot:TRINITY_DN5544_c0_g1_i2.p1 TRINITY_DN5544_c0_g1~~TRINITY_DN5544_c0_g1_i2.p1  ORF type:complete len:1147 (-),score=163.04 TRINITY_DN5544_c0_g1_i2:274-3450(-)
MAAAAAAAAQRQTTVEAQRERAFESFKKALENAGVSALDYVSGSAAYDLWQSQQAGKCKIEVVSGCVVQRVESVRVYLLAQVCGEERCLIEHDVFHLGERRQQTLMVPLERPMEPGDSYVEATRQVLAEVLGLDTTWQDTFLDMSRDNYSSSDVRGKSPHHPSIELRSTVHEVQVRVKMHAVSALAELGGDRFLEQGSGPVFVRSSSSGSDLFIAESLSSSSPQTPDCNVSLDGLEEPASFATVVQARRTFESIGLPSGRTFFTLCDDDPAGQSRQDRVHAWCWRSRDYERNGRLLDFEKYLSARSVDVNSFGVRSNKTLFQFYTEVKEKRTCHLMEVEADEHGGRPGLLRVVELLKIKLVAEVHRRKRVLTQVEELLDDGRSRQAKQLLVKKMEKSQDWKQVAKKVIAVRLGIAFDLQEDCFSIDQGSVVYTEEVEPSKGYAGIMSQYNIRTVTINVVDPDHSDLERIGLPLGNGFVTKEGEMSANMGGSIHMWSWAPLEDEEPPNGSFSGTGLETLCRQLDDVENIVYQVSMQPQMARLGSDAALKRALQKIRQCSELVFDIDSTVGTVDVRGMMMGSTSSQKTVSTNLDEEDDLSNLADFITSNFTRGMTEEGRSRRPGDKHRRSGDRQLVSFSEESPGEVEGRPDHSSASSLSTCLRPVQDRFLRLRDGTSRWGFNFVDLGSECGEKAVFQMYGEVVLVPLSNAALGCSPTIARSFLEAAASSYHDNPYHGALHATQVCHLGQWLKHTLGLDDSKYKLESASFVIAALCHDVKHYARNNAFCVNAEEPVALLYNNIKVLENMHAATCLELMQSAQMISCLDRKERALVRSHIIEYILATDMAEHFEGISKFRVRREAPDFTIQNEMDRRMLARMCLKAGDIGHSALPWEQHKRWSVRLTREFFTQGDSEKRLGLPISPLCDRSTDNDIAKSQKGFLDFVCFPLFDVISDYHKDVERHRQVEMDVRATHSVTLNSITRLESQEPTADGQTKRRGAHQRSHSCRFRRGVSCGATSSLGESLSAVEDVCIRLLRANIEYWRDKAEDVAEVKAMIVQT